MTTTMMLRTVTAATVLLITTVAHAVTITDYPALSSLVEKMIADDAYPRAELEAVINDAVIDPGVIRAMNKQFEALPWHRYRARFVNDARINAGVKWSVKHHAALQRAQKKFGVPPSIVAALIGVETFYGRQLGHRRVLDSLVTLTAAYPRRSAYFSRELRAFLNTARAEGIDAGSVHGSFAGAVGIPQFMPTSYAAYAVDLNGDGIRDLAFSVEDAIGSVANYLKKRGWRRGGAVFADLPGDLPAAAADLVTAGSQPTLTAADLAAAGVTVTAVVTDNAAGVTTDAVTVTTGGVVSKKMALLKLRDAAGNRHIVAFHNFHVITHYNPSTNYALAVAELARELELRRHGD